MNLFEWKKLNGFSAFDIAKLIDVDKSLLSHLKAGRRRPSPSLALRIEQVTKGAVTRDEMLYPELYQDQPPLQENKTT